MYAITSKKFTHLTKIIIEEGRAHKGMESIVTISSKVFSNRVSSGRVQIAYISRWTPNI